MEELAKSVCPGCEVNLEFPLELAGSTVACPKCGSDVALRLPDSLATFESTDPNQDSSAHSEPAAASAEPLSVATILRGFQGEPKWHGTPVLYQCGLLLVTVMIVMLPLVYIGLVAAAGYAVYWWSLNFTWLLGGGLLGGIYVALAKMVVYAAPIFAGVVAVFFMLKPLLARVPKGAQPLALNPANEPLIFLLVTRVCQLVGAPMPTRIDVCGDLNAAAGFRRGFRSFLGRDLVLTLGLPLVASMSTTQLAGVIAHELGHFTQGFAMRLDYIIRRVSGWFARVAYQRDQWDLLLMQWAEESSHWSTVFLLTAARLGVWTSRLVLKVLMWIGVAASSFISRQMEYHADLFQIKLVGSDCFEKSTVRLAVFEAATYIAY
jgi:Zn-dependent protease with chaperone function